MSWAFALAEFEGGLFGPVGGILIDKLGPRRMLLIGLLIFRGRLHIIQPNTGAVAPLCGIPRHELGGDRGLLAAHDDADEPVVYPEQGPGHIGGIGGSRAGRSHCACSVGLGHWRRRPKHIGTLRLEDQCPCHRYLRRSDGLSTIPTGAKSTPGHRFAARRRLSRSSRPISSWRRWYRIGNGRGGLYLAGGPKDRQILVHKFRPRVLVYCGHQRIYSHRAYARRPRLLPFRP